MDQQALQRELFIRKYWYKAPYASQYDNTLNRIKNKGNISVDVRSLGPSNTPFANLLGMSNEQSQGNGKGNAETN